jgi:hypothetical protein
MKIGLRHYIFSLVLFAQSGFSAPGNPTPSCVYKPSDFPVSRFSPSISTPTYTIPKTHAAFASLQVGVANAVQQGAQLGISSKTLFQQAFESRGLVWRTSPKITPFFDFRETELGRNAPGLSCEEAIIRAQRLQRIRLYYSVRTGRELWGVNETNAAFLENVRSGMETGDWIEITNTAGERERAVADRASRGYESNVSRIFSKAPVRLSTGVESLSGLVIELEDTSLLWGHFAPDENAVDDVFRRIDAMMEKTGSVPDWKPQFVEATFVYYQSMPLDRGGAGMGNALFAGTYSAVSGKPLKFIDGIDRYALSMTQDRFGEWYLQQLQSP